LQQACITEKEGTMKKIVLAVLVLFVITGWLGVAFADNHAVKVADKEGIGKYLTDAKGMTLDWFTKDSAGKSACTGPCLEKWPIYYRESVAPPARVKAGDFGTITREDGKKQTTFRGYPLYYWFQDKKAGDTGGNKINNVWFVIDPANFPLKK